MKRRFIFLFIMILLIIIWVPACSSGTEATPCPTLAPCPECPETLDCSECPQVDCPVCDDCSQVISENIPGAEDWAGSAHNDEMAVAFQYWNEEDPPEIPGNCAVCHSTTGYVDYVGGDGSEAFVVDLESVNVGETIECMACHNPAAISLEMVPFPSGAVITDLGAEARCMICHQGRASKVQVDNSIEILELTENPDTISEELHFINIHYYAAAATLYGTATKGGYEYSDKSYDYKNDHVEGFDTCIGCHESHSLELKLNDCANCHENVGSVEDVRNIRMVGSLKDYNGNGDIEEGIASEISGLRDQLYQAIQAYGSEVNNIPVVYDSATYPYFFIDSNANGEPDSDEITYENQYNGWTARLLKAAYNYQTASKDPGAYAHGGKYIVQLLYDSITDLNEVISSKVDQSSADRIDAGHFAGSEPAFRHWDDAGSVPGDCAKCHSSGGLPIYLVEGANVSEPVSNGLNCATCHDDLTNFSRYQVNEVEFPSGAVLSFGGANDSNLCINCHQGRESTVSVNAAIAAAGVDDDEISAALNFKNPHYFAAGATLFGTEAKGAYEYDGQSYNSRNLHVPGFATCLGCHETHSLEVKEEDCALCHNLVTQGGLESIRITPGDFDGDGDEIEGMAGELATMADALLTALQTYATNAGTPIGFSSTAYPYFFNDLNGNDVIDPDEANRSNAFTSWSPRLLKAAYNYQWYLKDPGAYAHNGTHMIQVIYDSMSDLGIDMSGFIRPEVVIESDN